MSVKKFRKKKINIESLCQSIGSVHQAEMQVSLSKSLLMSTYA